MIRMDNLCCSAKLTVKVSTGSGRLPIHESSDNGFPRYLRLIYRLPLCAAAPAYRTPVTVLCQFGPGRSIVARRTTQRQSCRIWWSQSILPHFRHQAPVDGRVHAGRRSWWSPTTFPGLTSRCCTAFAAVGFVAKAEIDELAAARLPGPVRWYGFSPAWQSRFGQRGRRRVWPTACRKTRRVAIFPEGGILPGDGSQALSCAVVRCGHRGRRRRSSRSCSAICRDGRHGTTISPFCQVSIFWPISSALLHAENHCVADVHVLPLIESAGKQRRQLAGEAEQAVRAAFESELPGE